MATIFLIGVDGSEGAQRAAEFAAERARREQATVVLAHVVDWSPYEALTPEDLASRPVDRQTEIDRAHAEVLDPVAKLPSMSGVNVQTVVRHGHPAETVCELATELGATQVFVGRRGRSRFSALLFGTVSGSIVQASPVPVTVVP